MFKSELIPLRLTEELKEQRKAWKCQHGHTGISHPNCYIKEHNLKERKGCLDIEAGGLKADFDIMLSWAIKTSGEDTYVYDHITQKDMKEQKQINAEHA